MNPDRFFLGIEIGGTKLQLGIGLGDGVLASLWRGPVEVAAGPEGIRRQILAAVPELLRHAGVTSERMAGVGIGFGGPVDDATHVVIKSHQIDGWDHFPLADWISEVVGWPAVLGNDADVGGLAEALFGAGKGVSPIFYITIGSGIGGGFIIDGNIYRGCGRGAAEVGHLRIASQELPGQPAPILEELASGWAIEKRARSAARSGNYRDSLVLSLANQQIDAITSVHVGKAAARGDEFAWSILNPAWDRLAESLTHVMALLCPRRIVIGGGVALMGEEVLFKPLRQRVYSKVFKPFADFVDIVPAALGEEMVVHGALVLAKRRFE